MDDEATEELEEEVVALNNTLNALSEIFDNDEGTPATLRMAAGALRRCADVCQQVADMWESDLREDEDE